jgi:alpha-ketoglutarate-dependent taurine dioxygenase
MKTLLIVNHSQENCGVQSYGKRVAQIFKGSHKWNVIYVENAEGVYLIRLVEKAGKDAAQRYADSMHVYDALRHLADAIAECATANHISGGMLTGKSSNGMEWNISYWQFGRRNPKNGHIDKRFLKKSDGIRHEWTKKELKFRKRMGL